MRYWKSGRNGEKDNDFTCSGGGIGRRSGLRIRRYDPYGFESRPEHDLKKRLIRDIGASI